MLSRVPRRDPLLPPVARRFLQLLCEERDPILQEGAGWRKAAMAQALGVGEEVVDRLCFVFENHLAHEEGFLLSPKRQLYALYVRLVGNSWRLRGRDAYLAVLLKQAGFFP